MWCGIYAVMDEHVLYDVSASRDRSQSKKRVSIVEEFGYFTESFSKEVVQGLHCRRLTSTVPT